MGRVVKVSWPEVGVSTTFELEDDLNRELCDDFWSALPFTSVQEMGLVNPGIIYTWVPTVNFSKINKTVLHSQAPRGCVTYSQGTGNKVIIKYGVCTEDCPAPVLGQVAEGGVEVIEKIGNLIWENYFLDKKIYTVRFERG